jgi:YD repeat-containing protein
MIEGLTHAQVETALGAPTISALLCKAVPSSSDFSSIRNAVKSLGGHITTFTYKPLVGIESQTLPNGYTMYYEYDGFGRLSRVVDNDGNVISTNSYNYGRP